MQTRRMPYRGNMSFGRGVNTLTGEVLGLALACDSPESTAQAPGQEAYATFTQVDTQEQLMDNLGLSVEASGSCGLFSAEGKFGISEKSTFNSQSTFVVASCRVQNAFLQVNMAHALPEAEKMLTDGKPDVFKTTYGDSYVRGLQTGGEFYAVFQVTSEDISYQKEVAASLHAKYSAIGASADVGVDMNTSHTEEHRKSDISIIYYQHAGQDEDIAPTKDVTEVLTRLHEFPKIARAQPCGYEAEVADYNTLALPTANPVEIENRKFAPEDYAKLRLKYSTTRNDLDFARKNRQYFENLSSDDVLRNASDQYGQAITMLMREASRIASESIEPQIFDPSKHDPPLVLPFIPLTRKNVPQDITVPNLISMSVDDAKKQLAALGLTAVSDAHSVAKDSPEAKNSVFAQDPMHDTLIQTNGKVSISYNFVPAERFPWIGPLEMQMHPRFDPMSLLQNN